MMKQTGGGARTTAVMSTVRRRVANRSLPSGAKLPSIRSLARSMQVSPSTVVEAYERLVAEGLIRSRPGSGFYVANQAAPLALADIGPRVERAIDPFWVSRQSLEAGPADIKPGCGWLPPDWLPEAALRKGLRGLSRADTAMLCEYGSPLGLTPLRQLISRRLGEQGIEAPPEQIMLTESGTQSIDLLCRFLIEPGDTVVVDDPCYFNFQALLKAHRVTIKGVPYTPAGPDIAALEQVLQESRPRLYITNSAIHNPTGATLSPATAHRVLKLAEQYGLTIIEDDIFADFEHAPSPRLAAFDGLERVIRIGSFSKTLSAAARCGYIAARGEWMDGLVDLKIATSFGGGPLDAGLVLSVLGDGGYRRHLDGMRARLARAMADVAARLREFGIVPWIEPQAGMFLWCSLPDGVDASELAKKALAHNVVLAPGNVFSVSQSAGNQMRFNVSQCPDKVFDVLRLVMR